MFNGLEDVQHLPKDNRRVPTYRDEFTMAFYKDFYFYSVRNRLELTKGDATIVKYYKKDLNDSIYSKWEWFKDLPTVKEFINET